MAYTKKIDHSCRHRGCKARAKFAVWGQPGYYGDYCAKHARQKVAELAKIENKTLYRSTP